MIVIIVTRLPVAALIWVATTFQITLPAAGSVVTILAGLFSLELASRIGPKLFKSPLHQQRKSKNQSLELEENRPFS